MVTISIWEINILKHHKKWNKFDFSAVGISANGQKQKWFGWLQRSCHRKMESKRFKSVPVSFPSRVWQGSEQEYLCQGMAGLLHPRWKHTRMKNHLCSLVCCDLKSSMICCLFHFQWHTYLFNLDCNKSCVRGQLDTVLCECQCPESVIQGRVVTSSGAPLQDVSIWLGFSMNTEVARTNRSGHFSMIDSCENSSYTLKKNDYIPLRLEGGFQRDGHPLLIHLEDAGTLSKPFLTWQ